MITSLPPPERLMQFARTLRKSLWRSARTGTLAIPHDWPGDVIAMLAEEWLILARDDQLPPDLGAHPCTRWLVMGGRGAGKTRTGAE